MRGFVATCLLLCAAAFSGCVEFVDEPSQADVDAAAAEAERALAEYQAKAGHIAGSVLDTEGLAIAGAVVDLVGTDRSVVANDAGEFAFLDLPPATYALRAAAEGYVDAQQELQVAAGEFTRPTLELELVPAPAPYYETVSFSGYQEMAGTPLSWCDCYFEVAVAEGAVDYVLEAELGSNWGPSQEGFHFSLDNFGYGGESVVAGWSEAPLFIRVPATDLGNGTGLTIHLQPDSDDPFHIGFQQTFTGYLTVFYGQGMPDGFTALDLQ